MAEDEIPDNHHHPNGTTTTATKKQKLSSYITPSEIRSEFCHHSPTIARINNGSFGCCPATIIAAQKRHHLQFLQQPDHFFFNLRQPLIHKSRSLIKTLINADHVSEISLLDNVTTAAAVVLQHFSSQFFRAHFSQNDAVLIFSCAFESVKKSIHAYVTLSGGSVVVVDLPFPVKSNSQIVSHFRNAVYNAVKIDGKRIRLAIIDHITSMPCVVMPIKELVRVCRDEGVDSVFVDAAHAIGTVNVDVKDIGADFYVSNLHKWFFCPPSVAFFYCRKSGFSSELHHPVVSHEYGNGLAVESAWIGTRDCSAQLVVLDVLEFVGRFEGGIEGIMRRNHEAVVVMGKMLAEAWGTNLGCPPEMCSSMAMVGFPASLGVLSNDDALKLRNHLRDEFGVEVPLYYHQQRDGEVGVRDRAGGLVTGYARISHQVYNTVDDYIKFRDAINRLVQDGFSCKMLA